MRKTTGRKSSGETSGHSYKHGRGKHGQGAWGHAGDTTKGFRDALRGPKSDPRNLRRAGFRKIGKACTGEGDKEAREVEGNLGRPQPHSQVRTWKERTTMCTFLRDHVKRKGINDPWVGPCVGHW